MLKKKEAQSQEQMKANEFCSQHQSQQEEMISTNLEEYRQFERQWRKCQAEISTNERRRNRINFPAFFYLAVEYAKQW